MLQIQDLHYSIGERSLLCGIDWIINPGKRSALIGPNGAGKTTLLRILTNEIDHYAGTITKPKNYRIGYLPQEEIAIGQGTVLESVFTGQHDVIRIEQEMHRLHQLLDSDQTDHASILKQLGDLETKFESLGGYRLEATAKSILSGLGFSEKDFSRSLSEFSGGWRMRSYLSRLLVQKPDLLLLDEPTNHLDLPSLEWLEQYLLSFPGSIVIVSHDRFFIDRLAQDIFELDRGKLTHFAGNYHFYEIEKDRRDELLLKRWEEQQAERERQEKFINRFRYKATKAVQVQSRIKRLEKLEEITLPPARRHFDFTLTVDVPSYKEVLEIDAMSFRYTADWVLQDVQLTLYRGDKVSLVGVNGAGKTTLTRIIAGQLAPQLGKVTVGQRTKIGYYAQHQVETLDLNATIYDEVAATVANSLVPRIRDVLGIFQFSGNDVFKKIGVLSGGEKARVSLAKILISPVNFLIMDEPTNHLDIISKQALEQALAQYDGTLLLISHDRYFLDKLVHRVIEVKGHQLREYEGNYSDYLARRELEQAVIPEVAEKPAAESKSRKTKKQKRIEAEARQSVSKERQRLKNEIDLLERDIENLEKKKEELEFRMADPATYKNGEFAASLQKDYASVKETLSARYIRWEEAHVELDKILSALA
ncbi:MAG: ATP-binding cassette domain-containing protein [Candidatus Zhuqueibacterota bacterium]